MKKLSLITFHILVFVLLCYGQSNEIQTNGKVCGKIPNSCKDADSNDLVFKLPAKLTWQKNYYSAFFYAVILKSRPAVNDENVDDDKCRQGYYSEVERLRIQTLFPNNKVFASRNGCYMPQIWYTNANAKYEFVAVYAGETELAAKAFLKTVKSNPEFTDANIRKMKVVLGYGD